MINDKLKVHFIRDYGLPISIYSDPYFLERLDLFEKYYGSRTKWENLLRELGEMHPDTFLNFTIEKTKEIISKVEESEVYQEFKSGFREDLYESKIIRLPNKDIYSGELVGHHFLSIDLVKANFQALKFFDPEIVYNCDSWEEFIKKFTDSDYMAKTKLSRQRILGKLEPKSQVILEKYLISGILSEVIEDISPISVNNDEIIFDITDYPDSPNLINRIYEVAFDNLGIRVRIDSFILRSIQLFTPTGKSIFGFWKDFEDKRVPSFHGIPASFLPQFIKVFEGRPISDSDLMFVSQYNDLPAKFMGPLIKK